MFGHPEQLRSAQGIVVFLQQPNWVLSHPPISWDELTVVFGHPEQLRSAQGIVVFLQQPNWVLSHPPISWDELTVVFGHPEQLKSAQGIVVFLQQPNWVLSHPPIIVSLIGREWVIYRREKRIAILEIIFYYLMKNRKETSNFFSILQMLA
jgi:hypothetical protein